MIEKIDVDGVPRVNLTGAEWRAVLAFAGVDDPRSTIQFPWLDSGEDGVHLVATDGHKMLALKVSEASETQARFVAQVRVPEQIKVNGKTRVELPLSLDGEVSVDGMKVGRLTCDVTPPDFRVCKPRMAGHEVGVDRVTLSMELLSTTACALSKLASGAWEIRFTSSTGAVMFTNPMLPDSFAVQMPIRP